MPESVSGACEEEQRRNEQSFGFGGSFVPAELDMMQDCAPSGK